MYAQQTINCNGRLLVLSKPIVMGILNITPDSFYDGGKYQGAEERLQQVDQMIAEGASIIDIGGMSSRPGAAIISPEEEASRVLPVIEELKQNFPDIILSIDTVQATIARQAIEAGAHLVNDISAGTIDPAMYATVGDLQVPYILMHMQGKPENMQDNPAYQDVTLEVLDFFIAEVGKLRALGIKDIVLDPGFGFGKRIADNYQLLKKMHVFKILEIPILAGLSRKSMIYKVLNGSADTALNGTSALHMVALQQGASILRAHDVKEAMEVIQLWEQLQQV